MQAAFYTDRFRAIMRHKEDMITAAVDLGGTRIKVGLIEKGKLLVTSKIEARPEKTIEEILDEVSAHVHELLAKHSISRERLGGFGISFPGIVDRKSNRVVSKYVKYKNAYGFDFNAWGNDRWQVPAAVENDARAALLGEWQCGAGRGYESIVLLTLGTGVGSAVLIERKLLRGSHHLAGNLGGHVSINLEGEKCNCGFFGCLESEASTWALSQIARRHRSFDKSSLSELPVLEFAHLFEHADAGDFLAKHMVEHCMKAWGVSAVNMVHCYDPEVIVIGGGIMKRSEIILPYVQNMVDTYSWVGPGTTRILAAQQIEYAALLGMDYLVSRLNIEVS
jgi:glucokinase